MKTLNQLWRDESGFILSSELVLIATICVIGLIGGMTCLRDSVTAELNDVAGAIGNLNQSYCYTGFSSASWRCCKARTAGSCFTDEVDEAYMAEADIYVAPEKVIVKEKTVIVEEEVVECQECLIEETEEAVTAPVPHVIEEKTEEIIIPCPTTPCPLNTESVETKAVEIETVAPALPCPPAVEDCPCESATPQHGSIPAPNSL